MLLCTAKTAIVIRMKRDETDSRRDPSGARPSLGDCLRDPVLLLATGGGLGLAPWASGTFGALWGLPLTLAAVRLADVLPEYAVWIYLTLMVLLAAVGVPLCTHAMQRFGGEKDPSAIVWDEFSTVPLVFVLVPLTLLMNPVVLGLGFLLHRVFDIVKPPPCRWLERLPRGLGIMADDWAAALYACLVLHLLLWLQVIPSAG